MSDKIESNFIIKKTSISKCFKEEDKLQDENRLSTAASDLNKSLENLGPKNLNIEYIDQKDLINRKESAPCSISSNLPFNLLKCGKGPKGDYFNKLLCKGLLY